MAPTLKILDIQPTCPGCGSKPFTGHAEAVPQEHLAYECGAHYVLQHGHARPKLARSCGAALEAHRRALVVREKRGCIIPQVEVAATDQLRQLPSSCPVCGVNPLKSTIRYSTLSVRTRYFCGAVYEIDRKGIRVVVGCGSAGDLVDKLRDA